MCAAVAPGAWAQTLPRVSGRPEGEPCISGVSGRVAAVTCRADAARPPKQCLSACGRTSLVFVTSVLCRNREPRSSLKGQGESRRKALGALGVVW